MNGIRTHNLVVIGTDCTGTCSCICKSNYHTITTTMAPDWGIYKVRNEIETKRNETKRNQQKRNETKRNEINEMKTK